MLAYNGSVPEPTFRVRHGSGSTVPAVESDTQSAGVIAVLGENEVTGSRLICAGSAGDRERFDRCVAGQPLEADLSIGQGRGADAVCLKSVRQHRGDGAGAALGADGGALLVEQGVLEHQEIAHAEPCCAEVDVVFHERPELHREVQGGGRSVVGVADAEVSVINPSPIAIAVPVSALVNTFMVCSPMQVPSEVGTKLTGAVVVVIGRCVGSLGDREVGDHSVGVCSRMWQRHIRLPGRSSGIQVIRTIPLAGTFKVVPQRERRCCAGGVQDAGLVTSDRRTPGEPYGDLTATIIQAGYTVLA